MRLLGRAEPFERRDLGAVHRADRRDAGADGRPVDDHRAGAALAEAAAELRSAEREVVAEDIEQRRRRIDVDRVRLAIHGEADGAHRGIIERRTRCFVEPLRRRTRGR